MQPREARGFDREAQSSAFPVQTPRSAPDGLPPRQSQAGGDRPPRGFWKREEEGFLDPLRVLGCKR